MIYYIQLYYSLVLLFWFGLYYIILYFSLVYFIFYYYFLFDKKLKMSFNSLILGKSTTLVTACFCFTRYFLNNSSLYTLHTAQYSVSSKHVFDRGDLTMSV